MRRTPYDAYNLLTNADFSGRENGFPAGWEDGQKKRRVTSEEEDPPPETPAALQVEVTTAVSGRSGEIGQTVPVKPNTRYQLTGWVRGSRDGAGF